MEGGSEAAVKGDGSRAGRMEEGRKKLGGACALFCLLFEESKNVCLLLP